MKEVKKCSLSGVAFTMDTDAYDTLSQYLNTLKKSYTNTSEGEEIVADIEARIAELILSTQNNNHVVENPLILNIIQQMGTPEDISENTDCDLHCDTPRIPRRLYRDTENAKLGGVCSGAGKYFDIDPVWIRMVMFVPFLLSCLWWIPGMDWAGPMMGNLFGIIIICYLIMWFAVPQARSARQKLEMNGEKITVQSIHHTTETTSGCAPDTQAKPIIASLVLLIGQAIIILFKIIAGVFVFGLIMVACAIIIAISALLVGANEMALIPDLLRDLDLWVPVLGLFIILIPVALLIYVLMCMIASRKPGGKSILALFLIWLAGIIAFISVAIHENAGAKFLQKRSAAERILDSKVMVDGDTTTLEQVLQDFSAEKQIEEGRRSIHIRVPSKQIDITIDKQQSSASIQSGVEHNPATETNTPSSETAPDTRH